MSAHPPNLVALPRLMTLVLIAGMLGMLSCAPSPQPRTIPLSHSAYVWKQGWDTRTIRELSEMEIPAALEALNVLVGECGLSSGRRSMRPPWKELAAHGRPLSLSVRIGTRKAVGQTGGIDLAEGFDLLLSDADGFAELIAAADGWTLQLHGTSRPKLGERNELFSDRAALRWTNQARRFGRPFRVALPTYAYLACFGKHGEYLGMHAEQSGFPTGTFQTIPLPADPRQVQAYLRALEDARFGLVVGVDWFRLPFPGDRQNWTMRGLGDILAGRLAHYGLELKTEQRGGLHDLSVINSGDHPVPLPSVSVEWSKGRFVAADATYAWQAHVTSDAVTFSQHRLKEFLAPGERRIIGWLRIDEDEPISTRLIK